LYTGGLVWLVYMLVHWWAFVVIFGGNHISHAGHPSGAQSALCRGKLDRIYK